MPVGEERQVSHDPFVAAQTVKFLTRHRVPEADRRVRGPGGEVQAVRGEGHTMDFVAGDRTPAVSVVSHLLNRGVMAAQAGLFPEVPQVPVADHREVRGRQLHDVGRVVLDDLEDDHGLRARLLPVDDHPPAGNERREERRHGEIERERGEEGPRQPLPLRVHPARPPDVVHQASMADQDALGRAGCTAGVDERRQVVRLAGARLLFEARRIGLAEVNLQTCLPYAGREACHLCVDECHSAGYHAIEFTRVHTEVDAAGKPTGRIEPLSADELPLRLPDLQDFKPTGSPEPPLAKAKDWLSVTRNGKRYLRETNTMPQWAGSCWYYLRYIDPQNDKIICDPKKEKYWMPVDLYVGGAEHAVLHLLYARFWHKVLYDRGHVSTPEPFQRLVNQGMILGEMEYTGYKQDGKWVSAEKVDILLANEGQGPATVKLDEDKVEKKGDAFVLKDNPNIRIDARAYKMSKSRGNVINPDDVVKEYGADSLRLYEMFMGPLEATKPWSMRGVEGVFRFLNRVWRLIIDERANHEPTVMHGSDHQVRGDNIRFAAGPHNALQSFDRSHLFRRFQYFNNRIRHS